MKIDWKGWSRTILVGLGGLILGRLTGQILNLSDEQINTAGYLGLGAGVGMALKIKEPKKEEKEQEVSKSNTESYKFRNAVLEKRKQENISTARTK